MPLEQHPIDFPWQLFMQAAQMKNQNQRNMYHDIEGIGSGFGKIGTEYQKQKARQDLLNALNSVRGGTVPGGPVAGEGGATTPPQVAAQGPQAPGLGQLAALQQVGFPDQTNPYASAMANQFDPEKQANIRHLNAETEAIPANTQANVLYKQVEMMNSTLQLEISKMMQEGRLEEAKRAAEVSSNLRLMQEQLQAQSENAKHPFRNFKRSVFGQGPLIPIPGQSQAAPGFAGSSDGWSIKKH